VQHLPAVLLYIYLGAGYFQLHSISTLPNVAFDVLHIVVGLLHSWANILASVSGELQGMGMWVSYMACSFSFVGAEQLQLGGQKAPSQVIALSYGHCSYLVIVWFIKLNLLVGWVV